MPAIGMGLLWAGYTLVMWGYCQVKGYDISLTELVVPKKYKGKWPPPMIKDAPSGPYGGQLGGGPGNPDKGGNGVPPGDHPGDAPWSYPHGGGVGA